MSENIIEDSRKRLNTLLRDLFQFDAADLDFGIYKIMNQKRVEIEKFIEKDLFTKTETVFKEYAGASSETLKADLKKLRAEINKDFGEGTIDEGGEVNKNHDAPKVQVYLQKQNEARKAELTQGQIDDVYNYVYEFFNRYYDSGDFLSKRRYGGKEKYVVPFNGEEVMLHWANEDQYYVKTGEYFTNYNFKADGWAVYFVLVHAEVEQNNLKGNDRFFIQAEDSIPVIDIEKKVLTVSFEYRELTKEENGRFAKRNTQDYLIEDAEQRILDDIAGSPIEPILKKQDKVGMEEQKPIKKHLKKSDLLGVDEQTLIKKHLKKYVKKNTTDYFIHKDLGGFLTRELDFFIKNEILQVDEIIRMNEGAIRQNMAMVKAIHEICVPIIEFLKQIENFQKMLFEKKKFVLRVEYCMTLDQVPKELYPEIAINKDQVAEWKQQYALDDVTKDSIYRIKGKEVVTPDFLETYPYLMIDTKFFNREFNDRLLSSFTNLDDIINGLIIKSENWQALNILKNKYSEKIDSVYVDPPYNTDASSILYKNDYKDSSWLSLMANRLDIAYSLISHNGIFCAAIDDEEVMGLKYILSRIFIKEIGIATVRSNPAGRKTKGRLAPAHEYALFYGKSEDSFPGSLEKSEKSLARFPLSDESGRFAWTNFIRSGSNDKREDRPKLFYPIFVHRDDTIKIPCMKWDEPTRQYSLDEQPSKDEEIIYPIVNKDGKNIEKNWQRGHQRASRELDQFRVRRTSDGKISIDFKTYMDEKSLPITWWDNNEYASANHGAAEMKNLFGKKVFDFAKSSRLIEDCLKTCGMDEQQGIVLDFFAGSGTSGRAIINLNREDGGNRKYILVEMGDYFNTVLKPGIIKTVFSREWKEGKPTSYDAGTSHVLKCVYLESFEDTLNNIIFQFKSKTIQETLETYDDYFLRYMLEYETRESPTRLALGDFTNPFQYKIKTVSGGEERNEPVDLVETFNYLLGLQVERISSIYDGKRYYKAISGKKRDGRSTLIVWRETIGIDLIHDKEIIEKSFLKDWQPDVIYVNGICHVNGALPIESDFKKFMGA